MISIFLFSIVTIILIVVISMNPDSRPLPIAVFSNSCKQNYIAAKTR